MIAHKFPTYGSITELSLAPASLILDTLFAQMTIETTSRDPSTAAEFTLLHAARCKLRHNLPNLFPCPSFCRGYVRLMIHTRISARAPRLLASGSSTSSTALTAFLP